MKHCKLITFIAAILISSMTCGFSNDAPKSRASSGSYFSQLINPPNSMVSWTVFAYINVSVTLENFSKQLVTATLTNRSYVTPTDQYCVMLPHEIVTLDYSETAFLSGCYWTFELTCTQTGVHITATTKW